VNASFDQHVDGTAGHDQMLDIVSPEQDQLAPSIYRCSFNYAQPFVTAT